MFVVIVNKIILFTFTGFKRDRLAVRTIPATENTLSLGVLVAGMLKSDRANPASQGNVFSFVPNTSEHHYLSFPYRMD